MAYDRPILRVGGVLLVTKHGIAVADSVDEVEHGANGGVPNEVFGPQAHTNHCLGSGDGLGSDSLNLR